MADIVIDMFSLARDIASIVRRQGQHDFTDADEESQLMSVSLCGLTVLFDRDRALRFKSHDMDLQLSRVAYSGAANDQAQFSKGDLDKLQAWHAFLMRLHSVFHGPAVAA